MSKRTASVVEEPEVEETEVDTDTDTEEETTTSFMTPKQLAEELEIDPKTLRGFLRREFPRDESDKNTSWKLTDDQVEAARAKFTASDEDEDDETDVEDDEA